MYVRVCMHAGPSFGQAGDTIELEAGESARGRSFVLIHPAFFALRRAGRQAGARRPVIKQPPVLFAAPVSPAARRQSPGPGRLSVSLCIRTYSIITCMLRLLETGGEFAGRWRPQKARLQKKVAAREKRTAQKSPSETEFRDRRFMCLAVIRVGPRIVMRSWKKKRQLHFLCAVFHYLHR